MIKTIFIVVSLLAVAYMYMVEIVNLFEKRKNKDE